MANNNDLLSDITKEKRGYEKNNNQLLKLIADGFIDPVALNTFSFQGVWNADTNTPNLSDANAGASGDFYVVSVAGSQDLGHGTLTFAEGDWVVWSDFNIRWNKVIASNSVVQVNGKTGHVELTAEDVGAATNTDILEAVATLLQSIYPVGSVFISGSNSIPAAIATVGTWTRVEDRVIIGASNKYPVDSTGGEDEHTLTVNEMPSHNHEVSNTFFSGGGGTFSVQSFGGSDYNKKPVVESRGGGEAHNNMQPYKAKFMWERIS